MRLISVLRRRAASVVYCGLCQCHHSYAEWQECLQRQGA